MDWTNDVCAAETKAVITECNKIAATIQTDLRPSLSKKTDRDFLSLLTLVVNTYMGLKTLGQQN